jgi:hypothetical protein
VRQQGLHLIVRRQPGRGGSGLAAALQPGRQRQQQRPRRQRVGQLAQELPGIVAADLGDAIAQTDQVVHAGSSILA